MSAESKFWLNFSKSLVEEFKAREEAIALGLPHYLARSLNDYCKKNQKGLWKGDFDASDYYQEIGEILSKI